MTTLTQGITAAPRAQTQTNLFWGRLVLVACFAIPLMMDAFGQAPYYGLIYKLYPWTTLAALCITAFLVLLLLVTPDVRILHEFGGTWGRRGMMLLSLLTIPFGFTLLGGRPSLPVLVLFGIFFLFYIGIVIWNPRSMLWFLALAVVYGLFMRLRYINAFEIFSGHADMLPLIIKASERFIGGQQPYVDLYSMPHIIPLSYLPVMWLSYTPAVALGVDVRVVNMLYEVGIVALFLSLVLPLRHRQETNVAIGYAAFLFILPTSLFYDSFTSHVVMWFWVLLALRLILARRIILSAIPLGIAFGAAQLAFVAGPALAIYIWRAFGFKKLLVWGILLFGVTALLIAPFALWNPKQFFQYVIVFYSDLSQLGQVEWARDQRWLFIVGFTAEAWRMGLQESLKYIQVILVLLLAAVFALKYHATQVNVLRFVILSLAFFLLFSPLVALYYHLIWMLILAFYLTQLGIRDEG